MIILPLRPDASWRHPPNGTIAVALSLLLVHILWGRGDPESLKPYLLDFSTFSPVQWLTSAFLHGDWLHLIGNCIFLFVFGAIVEDFLGRRFIPVYLLLAIGSSAIEQTLGLLMQREALALGASSAIYGLVAMAILWAPRTHVTTFLWLILSRPMLVRIRVQWLGGGYMVMQLFAVWVQGGEPSSEFLHACGIVIGLLVGVLFIRRRWIDTEGGDLLATGRATPASGPAAPMVTWDEQVARLEAAVAAGDRRVALAAWDVLRREHPARLPAPALVERLVALCEAGLDMHRAAAIAAPTVAAGSASPALRLRLARLRGQHLDEPEAGLALLRGILPASDLDPEEAAEHARLLARLERRQQTRRLARSRAAVQTMLLLALLSAAPSAAEGETGDGNAWPEAGSDPVPVAGSEPSDAAGDAAMPRELPRVDGLSGRVAIAGGAHLNVPEDCVYLPWPDVQRLLALPTQLGDEPPPHGLLATSAAVDRWHELREMLDADLFAQRSIEMLVVDAPVQVMWEEGWIDPDGDLPTAEAMRDDFRMHARLMNRRQVLGPGITFAVDDWGKAPAFDRAAGVLSWSFYATYRAEGAPTAIMSRTIHTEHACHLGARGTLRLLCESLSADAEVAQRLQQASAAVAWDAGQGFAPAQPRDAGERTGGFRRLMLPRLVFGDPAQDRLVHRRGLGLAWILIAVPAAILLGIIIWRIRAASRPPPAVLPPSVSPRCPACGTPLAPTVGRCPACGSSLARHR